MSKRLIMILTLAFVVGISFAAYAEVQNVKVSGDLALSGIMRGDWTLINNNNPEPSVTGDFSGDKQTYFLRQVRVRVDADLTDNVAAAVRLLNEGVWGNTKINQMDANDDQVDLDLAYVNLKEFLYSPLTVTLGRQELMFGTGMIVGDPDTNGAATSWEGTAAAVMNSGTAFYTPAPDLTLRKAFDAVKAVINYDPLVITGIYAKVIENNPSQDDDTDLFGINAAYTLSPRTLAELYWFTKNTGRKALDSTTHDKVNRVDTIGMRMSTQPKDTGLTAMLEVAGQLGVYNPVANVNDGSKSVQKRRAWASEAVLNYKFGNKYSPELTAIYSYFSGEHRTSASRAADDDRYNGWDPMYENQTTGHIVNALMAQSNSHILGFSGKMSPMEDVILGLDYNNYWLARKYDTADSAILNGLSGGYSYTMSGKRYLGQELDLSAVYNYTEDVQFGLLTGVFLPGKAFGADNSDSATELIGSMKVTF